MFQMTLLITMSYRMLGERQFLGGYLPQPATKSKKRFKKPSTRSGYFLFELIKCCVCLVHLCD